MKSLNLCDQGENMNLTLIQESVYKVQGRE